MALVDKALLLKPRVPEADVDLPGVGTVRVRGLSRAEALAIRSGDRSNDAFERRMVAVGMVAPALTEDEVGEWQQGSTAAELEVITRKINELSGLGPSAAKAAYKEFEADPDNEFRALPGGEAAHDGDPAAGGDAER